MAWWVARRIEGSDSAQQVGEKIAELYAVMYGSDKPDLRNPLELTDIADPGESLERQFDRAWARGLVREAGALQRRRALQAARVENQQANDHWQREDFAAVRPRRRLQARRI